MYQNYQQISWFEKDVRMKQGVTFEVPFQVKKEDVENKWHRLIFRGESGTFYMRKSEPGCTGQYFSIEDSLNMEKAQVDGYCLDLSSKEPVVYPKTAFYRVAWPPLLYYISFKDYYTEKWHWGISASAKNLKIEEGGYLRFRVEVFYKEAPGTEHDYEMIPDEEYVFDIEPGSYDLKEYAGTLHLPLEKIDHLGFYVEGNGYSGEVYIEHPFLTLDSIDRNILPSFDPILALNEKIYWVGVNLSKKEWPKFKIAINGKEVCNKEFFERCHRYTQYEYNLPVGSFKEGENTISFTLDPDFPVPFQMKEIGYYVEDNSDIVLLACPDTVTAGKEAKLLIECKKPNTTLSLETDCDGIFASPQTFEKAGYHVFKISCDKPVLSAKFSLVAEGGKVYGEIERIIKREEDGIITGSGDMIYINHEEMDDVKQFLAWYVGNHTGNLLTIRNVFRWSGARRLVPEVWEELTKLLNELDMQYAVMVDGRNLPGAYCNPTPKMVEGKGYLGRQVHERDGHVYGNGAEDLTSASPIDKANTELWAHVGGENRDTAEMIHNYKTHQKDGNKVYVPKNAYLTDDAKEAAEHFMECMQNVKYDCTRHTGITSVFKYMYQAGFDWLGAELMYTGHEVTGASIRGAAKGYHKDGFGAHLAVQWGSSPADDELHVRRYRLALYNTYISGYTEINTEEGFWWMEEFYSYHNRESYACKEHLKQQQKLYRYMNLNTRKGKFYTPFGYLHGRYDGWQNFGSMGAWGQAAFQHDVPEKGWQLMKLFYPLDSVSMMIYRYNAPAEPQGYFTGTPRGMLDVMPIETETAMLNDYKTLAFVGYHKAEDEDCEKILDYLHQGGTVIMGWPHLSVTTKRPDVIAGNHTYLKNELTQMLSASYDFAETTVDGKIVHINPALLTDGCEVVKTTDDGQPLLMKKQVGAGVLWFVNAREYPADEGVQDTYAEVIKSCSDQNNEAEPVFVSCGEDVQFAIYQREDGVRDIYLLAMDWYNLSEENRKATLRVGSDNYAIAFPFETMVKVVAKDDVAAWIVSEEAVVQEICDGKVIVSGSGSHTLYIAKAGKVEERKITFTDSSYLEVTL